MDKGVHAKLDYTPVFFENAESLWAENISVVLQLCIAPPLLFVVNFLEKILGEKHEDIQRHILHFGRDRHFGQ